MTTKSRDKGSVKTTDTKSNNLSLIKGIGPARRQWLRETFGIETLTDLAASSAEEIYTRLKEEQIVSLSKVESWIVQAKEIIDSGMHNSTLKVHENGWKPFASFVVEFQESVTSGEQQTKAHHVEADKTMKWSGIEYTALCDWFIEQLKDKVGLAVSVQSTSSPLQNTESGYNERLRFHLAKVTGQPQTPVAQQMAYSVSSEQSISTLASKPVSTESAAHLSGTREYSDELRAVLAKVTSKPQATVVQPTPIQPPMSQSATSSEQKGTVADKPVTTASNAFAADVQEYSVELQAVLARMQEITLKSK